MRTLTILAMVLLVGGCNTAATIYLKDGRIIEGKIKQSDSQSIYVKSKDSDEVIVVFRQSIKDIDHPGNGHAIVGTVLGVAAWTAAITVVALEADCEGWGCGLGVALISVPGFAVAIPSTAVAVWGWTTWAGSRSAAAFEAPRIAPLAMTDGERMYYGIGMSWSW